MATSNNNTEGKKRSNSSPIWNFVNKNFQIEINGTTTNVFKCEQIIKDSNNICTSYWKQSTGHSTIASHLENYHDISNIIEVVHGSEVEDPFDDSNEPEIKLRKHKTGNLSHTEQKSRDY